MKTIKVVALCLTLCSMFVASANQLTDHPSPYLALHGNDPVDWMPWSAEALEKAKKENKLLFISVGYYSCHWCHVMQRESFSNKAIAEKLNERFVSVKVDRELNPVLDQKLMTFLQSTSGRGGWPMNILLTPDGYPIVGITYLPASQFSHLLDQLISKWDEDNVQIQQAAEEVDGIIAAQLNSSQGVIEGATSADLVTQFVKQSMNMADELVGGFGKKNKFPSAPQLQMLSSYLKDNKNPEVEAFLQLTLKTMALSGLNDAVGDGFYRYTMDPNWQRPHFEKMLYTSAQLVPIYISAWNKWGDSLYRDTALRTLAFMSREMNGVGGGLIASLSAVDDKNIEGGYYLWNKKELQQLLTDEEYQLAISLWGIDQPSEYDEGNFPVWQLSVSELAATLEVKPARLESKVEVMQAKLIAFRNKSRVLPRDDKMLAGWNGLALAAYADGLQLDPSLKKRGSDIAGFISSLWDGKRLIKAMDNKGKPFGSGALPDYAGAAYGLISWGLAADDKQSLRIGYQIIQAAWDTFYSKNGWLEKEKNLLPNPLYKLHISGGSEPSAEVLLLKATRLFLRSQQDKKLAQKAADVIAKINSELSQSPYYYAGLVEIHLTNKN